MILFQKWILTQGLKILTKMNAKWPDNFNIMLVKKSQKLIFGYFFLSGMKILIPNHGCELFW